MFTKADFQQAYVARLLDYPELARRYRVQDPQIIGNLDAMATMMAMLSGQIDIADYEPFEKVRDATVLADATLKGILPLARAAQHQINISNAGSASYPIAAGRRILDTKGRIYSIDSGATVPANGSVTVTATQKTVREVTATVVPGGPFYRIAVPASAEDDTFLCGLEVLRGADVFDYRPDYFNVAPGDLAYQAETDENRSLFVVLGMNDVVGYEPGTGEVFTLQIEECKGQVNDIQVGAPFSLEYSTTIPDGLLSFSLVQILDQGQAPPDLETLRVLAEYPALYDHDAVFLGNFDYLIRRYLSPVRFLSVWNEQLEERARGPDVDNINKLFVAGLVDGMSDVVFLARTAELIRRADDSYVVVPRAVVNVEVPMIITATVAVVHEPAEVTAQIRAQILTTYGAGSKAVSRGGKNPINLKASYELLQKNVDALKDAISDLKIETRPPTQQLPEQFLYVSDASLTVLVQQAQYNTGLWNY